MGKRPDMEEELLFVASASVDGFGCFQFLGVVVHDDIHALSVKFPAEGLAFVGVSPVCDDFVDSGATCFAFATRSSPMGPGFVDPGFFYGNRAGWARGWQAGENMTISRLVARRLASRTPDRNDTCVSHPGGTGKSPS